MSDDAAEIATEEDAAPPAPDRTATVLPFPSNRPLDDDRDRDEPARLRDVIGKVLRDERRHQGRTLADVADDAAVSLPYLSEVERGRKDVSSDLLAAIADALELPLVEILERSADRLRIDGRASSRSAIRRMQGPPSFQLAA